MTNGQIGGVRLKLGIYEFPAATLDLTNDGFTDNSAAVKAALRKAYRGRK